MSIQSKILNFIFYYVVRPGTANGMDTAKIRASDMPEPKLRRTWGCEYERVEIDGVTTTIVRPEKVTSNEVVIHFHGGVYVSGISQIHWSFLSRLCQETGRLGVMVDYRLIPEHPFPAALNDAVSVISSLAEAHGAVNLIVSGDSAGGGLAVAAAMKLRDDGHEVPGKLVLLSPWLDITLDHPDIPAQEKKDRMMGRTGLVEAGTWYANGIDSKEPYLSPVMGDLSGLPPILLQIGGDEIFLPDCQAFKAKAEAQRVPLVYQEVPKMCHVWPLLFEILPEGEESLQEILQFIGK